jgi:lipopolysaccharide transport system permease protein
MSDQASRRDLGGENAGLPTFFARLWRHRELLRELISRELSDAYAGSVLAKTWAVLHPLLLIGLYLFVFGYVFVARVGAHLPTVPDFAVFMLSGLTCWLTVQSALGKATSSLVASTNLVKQVVFPFELLPIRAVIAAHIPLLIGLCIILIYSLMRFGIVSPLLPLVVPVILAQLMLLCGVALFLSALAVYIKDTRDLVQFFTAFGIFLMPVIYLPGTLPDWFDIVLYANPFSYAVWCLQDIFFFRTITHPAAWIILVLMAPVILFLGFRFFERTRSGFGDAL